MFVVIKKPRSCYLPVGGRASMLDHFEREWAEAEANRLRREQPDWHFWVEAR